MRTGRALNTSYLPMVGSGRNEGLDKGFTVDSIFWPAQFKSDLNDNVPNSFENIYFLNSFGTNQFF